MGHPLISLAGRSDRPRTILPVSVVGPTGSVMRDALLDTGSDETVFPESVAVRIGIDLVSAPLGGASGAAATRVPLRYAQVTLRIGDHYEQREWSALIGFTAAPLRYPLLGYAGFLQFFDSTFRGAREEVELTVNHLYAGT
jgi:hypothetical protein